MAVTKAANAHAAVVTGWTNPTNAYATTGNNVYATAAPAKSTTVSGDFGFPAFTTADIPDGSVINSVTATVEWKLSATTSATLGVQVHNPAGTALGAETTYASTTEAQRTAVVTSGVTLADLRNGAVKVRVRDTRGNTNTAHTGSLDFVSLTVDFSAAPPNVNGSVAISGGGALAASGATGKRAATSITGGGAITASTSGSHSGAGWIPGQGAFVSTGQKGAAGAVAVSGGGAVTATGSGILNATGAAAISGGGALSATGLAARSGQASLTAGGTVTSSVAAVRRGAVAIGAGGRITTSATSARSGSAGMSGGGWITSDGSSPATAVPHYVLCRLMGQMTNTTSYPFR